MRRSMCRGEIFQSSIWNNVPEESTLILELPEFTHKLTARSVLDCALVLCAALSIIQYTYTVPACDKNWAVSHV